MPLQLTAKLSVPVKPRSREYSADTSGFLPLLGFEPRALEHSP